jgi:uncharacterized membrane protein YhfC
MFITFSIVLSGLENIGSHIHLSNQLSISSSLSLNTVAFLFLSTLLNKGSHMFIKNSDEKLTVASPTDLPAPKFVIFLKSLVNHIHKVGS